MKGVPGNGLGHGKLVLQWNELVILAQYKQDRTGYQSMVGFITFIPNLRSKWVNIGTA